MKDTNNSADASCILSNERICRYPRPRKLIMDNDPEFKRDFKSLLTMYGIKKQKSSKFSKKIHKQTPTLKGYTKW